MNESVSDVNICDMGFTEYLSLGANAILGVLLFISEVQALTGSKCKSNGITHALVKLVSNRKEDESTEEV